LQRERGRILRGIARTVSPDARAADAEAQVNFDDMGEVSDAENVARAIIAQIAGAATPLSDLGDALFGIDEAFDSKLGSNPGLSAVASECYAMAKACEGFATAFAEPVPVTAAPEDEAATPTASAPAAAAVKVAALGIDSVRNRADVITAMDAIIRYYAETEPSSPVPMMIKRIRNWVSKDFLDVMKDIAPDRVEELTRLLVSRET
jgi:type VI secretion system protein ImpA